MNNADSPFYMYLAINYGRRADNSIWYLKTPLGKNKIGKLIKIAAQTAGLQRNITNHSVQKTCLSHLMDAEVSGNYVTLLSSHKNLKSLDSYKAASVKHQQNMLLILSCSCEQSTSSSSVSHLVQESSIMPVNPPKGVNPNKLFNPAGVFPGTCIGKIDGCSFTFNIHHEKKKAQSQQSPRREGLSSAMIPIPISELNWT